MASEWPEKYLVAEEIETSKPSAKGLKYSGVPQVLSIAVIILFFLANLIISLRSWNSKVMLPGFSTKINFVFLVILLCKSLILLGS